MLVNLEELKAHLKTLLPGFESGDRKVAEEDKKSVDIVLDIYLWAEARGEELKLEQKNNKPKKIRKLKDEAA
jgi:hypothetical protein